MPSLNQKHAHVKGQRSNHHIFKFQPNPSWSKKTAKPLHVQIGHFGILWFLNNSLYDEQTHFCLTKLFKPLEKILEFELWTA